MCPGWMAAMPQFPLSYALAGFLLLHFFIHTLPCSLGLLVDIISSKMISQNLQLDLRYYFHSPKAPVILYNSIWTLILPTYPFSCINCKLMWIKFMSGVMAVFIVPTTQRVLRKYMLNKWIYKWGQSATWNLRLPCMVLEMLSGHHKRSPFWEFPLGQPTNIPIMWVPGSSQYCDTLHRSNSFLNLHFLLNLSEY